MTMRAKHIFIILNIFTILHHSNSITVDFSKDSTITEISANLFKQYNVALIEKVIITSVNASRIHENSFSGMGKLKELDLNNCGLTDIPKNILHDLTSLTILDLSENKIGNLDADMFKNNGKLKELRISGIDLKYLQENLFSKIPLLTVLKLNTNEIAKLPKNVFSNLGHLQKLGLHENEITTIFKNQFSNLPNLKHLSLYGNSISEIDPETFKNNLKLEELSLNTNKLTDIKSGTLSGLTKLQSIDLSFNDIEHIAVDALPSNLELNYVFLQNNKLQYFDPQILLKLQNTHYMHLYENPWNCNKKFLDLLRAWRDLRTQEKIYSHEYPSCAKPERLAGKSWQELTDADIQD